MATKTKTSGSTSSKRSTGSSGKSNQNGKSAFSWGDNAGPLIGATIAGVALGFAANFGRKFMTQAVSGISGDWDEVLATEHEMALAIFDKMLATDSSQTAKRSMLLMQLSHALDKHAHEEEMVIYPALRQANETVRADELDHEHGEIKTFLYRLNQMKADDSNWLETVRQFRDLVQEHARMEEEQVFPAFKKDLTEEQNKKITSLVNADGFWQA